LIDIALLEIFEAEVGAEEPRRAILQGNPPLTLQRRCPHPLVGRAIRVIHNQECDVFYLGRREETQHRLAAPMRPESHEQPPLVGHLSFVVEDLQQPFITL
jgi:hypothetical protein